VSVLDAAWKPWQAQDWGRWALAMRTLDEELGQLGAGAGATKGFADTLVLCGRERWISAGPLRSGLPPVLRNLAQRLGGRRPVALAQWLDETNWPTP
jgi:hypothetical protein